MVGLIGRKLGMTQIFSESGAMIPVTVIEAGPCPVLQVKTGETDGYEAVQLGFSETRESRLTRPRLGHLKKNEAKPLRVIREFRLAEGHDLKTGDLVTVDRFDVGAKVDIAGTTKGRGFQGVVKRHGFSGGPKTHGSRTGNLPGSIGQSATPGRVIKGKKLPGQMGSTRVTTQNLEVVKVDPERNWVLVRGAVPGAPNSLVTIAPAVKSKKGN